MLIIKLLAVINHKKIYLSKTIIIQDTQIQVAAQTGLWRKQIKAEFIKAKTTKCSPFMQIRDCWLGSQGLASSSMQMRVTKATRRGIKSIFVHTAVPECLCLGLRLSVVTDLPT